ncbi:hypothetical protein HOD30_02460 [Candidatus Peregrinibacteria bacterium]|jgi:hypothetical protein|nr:hypothetical protein [Candidatus Peregrinibacteria bacterium]MBT4631539.1 hypothetical protein [Candidatus Peregrinibacteria bacterium]MBT5516366.1 hypothetical protein [Candidatus Peregrinibacteria bacterium]MBT5824277.1 hypothetical protein [Candidatus Peregrinibacteria bacterium]
MKTCTNCQCSFEIDERDRAFYERMSVPDPTHCPDCRNQRRLAARNERNLYHRKCDATGENILSLYSQDKPYKVIKESVWWSDDFDPMKYGRDYDFSRPFFEQFNELLLDVPRRAMHQDGTNENADYVTFGMNNKNAYLAFACFYCEDIYYSEWTGFSKDCMDLLISMKCELSYELVDCVDCYQCAYSTNSKNCHSSYLLDDCRNCSNCIACKNLRNKEYHIYNRPVSKEEFEKFKSEMLNGGLEEEKKRFNEWKLKMPNVCSRMTNAENCSGEYIENAKNCHNCFDLVLGSEDLKHVYFGGWKGKDMMDCSFAGKDSQLLYEIHATTNANNCAFSSFLRGGSDVFYSESMYSSTYCFGCTSLNHKNYCILNKQYTREEYEALVPKIIEHMKSTGEWGEFFPSSISPFAYNETLAQILYPMTKQDVLEKGWKWRDEDEAGEVREDLQICVDCGKNYRVIEQEAKLLGRLGLPEPKSCPKCRRSRRAASRQPYKLWDRNCDKCSVAISTSYAPERPEIVYCEACYLEEVY